ncbi:MAG: DNA glycosylase [Clostridiales bacterium]|nr:DNA glycosylase [Clostridiales bacterium]
MYTDYEIKNGTLTVRGIDRIDIERSCACGQSFRWKKDGDGFVAPALGRVVRVCQNDCDISIYPCKKGEEKDWLAYFDLDRDYAAIEKRLSVDEQLSMCIGSASGIRVFAQEPFETLITFIISANNNIGRIAGIVERLCALCGEKAEFDGKEYYLFPKPESIAALEESELVRIGSGYRAPYIKKSAAIIAGGYQLEKLRDMPLDIARKELLKFPGVGPKVADCVLLFGLGHTDAFPVDVWIGRAMSEIYFDGESPKKKQLEAAIRALGSESGIVQQYIFHYARQTALGKKRQSKTKTQ